VSAEREFEFIRIDKLRVATSGHLDQRRLCLQSRSICGWGLLHLEHSQSESTSNWLVLPLHVDVITDLK